MLQFHCRQGTKGDVSTIVDFQCAMAWETEKLKLDRETVTRGVHGVLDEPNRGQYFVVEESNQIVGSLLIIPEWSDWRNGTVWWIHSVYVKPEYRQKGAFKFLYNHIKSRVENDEKLFGLRLYVEKENERAQNVYEHLGMDGEHYRLFQWMKHY